MDGASLKEVLHQRGINLRYLGQVIKTISQSEHKERLRHIMVCLIHKIIKLILNVDDVIALLTVLSNIPLPVLTRGRS